MKKNILVLSLLLFFSAFIFSTIEVVSGEVVPNPFSPNKGPVTIKYLTKSSVTSNIKTTIKVYNMDGKLMRTIIDGWLKPAGVMNIDVWDGKDDRGRVCLNGRYLLKIEIEDAGGKRQKIYSVVLVK